MFDIKAKKGNISLEKFNIQDLIDTANQNTKDRNDHNALIKSKFNDLVDDYFVTLNKHLSKLDLKHFVCENGILNLSTGSYSTFYFGHGRGSIKVSLSMLYDKDGKYQADFKGTVTIHKNWLRDSNGNGIFSNKQYNLESVAQIFDLGEDVFKLHLIDRKVKDHIEREKLEKLLTYTNQ